MRIDRNNGRFFLLQVLFWAAYCVLFGYTVTIFGAYGYSAQACGIVTTLQYIVLLVAQPVYGYLMDNLVSPKWFFVGLMVLGGLGALGLPWAFTQPMPILMGYFLVLSFFIFCAPAVAETWCISVINYTPGMDYGLVRSGGSISYAVTGLITGNIIAPLGIRSLFGIHVAVALLAAALAVTLPDPVKLREHSSLTLEKPPRVSFGKAIGFLLKNKPFVIYTLCMTCYNFASRATQVYMPIILAGAGGGDAHYGLSLFIASGGEMLVMLWVSRLVVRGVRMERLFGTALAIFVVRFFLLAAVNNLWVILAGQVLLSVGFGLQVRVHTQYLSQITPEGYQGTAILLCASVASGLGAMLGNYCGGEMIEQMGTQPYLYLCAAVLLVGFLLFLPTVLSVRRQEKEEAARFLLRQLEEERP